MKVILVNTVHLPNWNMTLSQKLRNCPEFITFIYQFWSPFRNLSLSIWNYCVRQLWIENTDFESYCGQQLPSQSFHSLDPCFLHFPAWIPGTFSNWWVGLWQLAPYLCALSSADVSLGSWPHQLSWALLLELGWWAGWGARRSKLLPVETRSPAHSTSVAGARGGNL